VSTKLRENSNNESHELMKPGTETKAGAAGRKAGVSGKRWIGKRVQLGKGGQKVGKWCSFSHFETALARLFPHDSTQVVDFPHLSAVSIFLEGGITTEIRRHRAKRSQEPTKRGLEPRWRRLRVRIFAGKITDCYAKFGFPSPPRDGCPMELFARAKRGHESPRKFAQIRAVNPRCYALLRVGLFFNHGWTRIDTDSERTLNMREPRKTRFLASQARHKLDAPSGLFACAKRGRIVTGGANFRRELHE
jgi:hypothetical protein